MDDIIYGFKAFNKGLVNRYGTKYELNKHYHYDGEIKFGNDGHGFHMCQNLEDVFRFFDEECEVAAVIGWGNRTKRDDDYKGAYDMYVTENMLIDKVLTREEIFEYMLNINDMFRLKTFIMFFKMNEEEKELFKEKVEDDVDLTNTLKYYQYGNKRIWYDYYGKGKRL